MPGNPAGAVDSREEAWRRRLAEADNRYREALRAYAEAEVLGDRAAIAAAAEHRTVVRQEYQRTLRIFSDMVIRGKRPSD